MQGAPNNAAPMPTYKRQVLTVDSRSRENFDLTTPAQYKVVFPPIRNVIMVRLLSTEVPNTEYVIHSRNNKLFLWDAPNLTEHAVTLSPGTYTATELANELNKQLNAALAAQFGAIFQVAAMTMTSKMRIDRVDGLQWGLRFAGKSSTAALVLGFDPDTDAVMQQDPFSGNWYTQSVTIMNLAGENFVYLCIKGMPTLITTERVNDVFAKIIYNVPPRSIAFDSFVSNAFIVPQTLTLSQLEVSFVRHDGYLVDFNDIDHSFSLEFFTTN
jgi:hypothetical protein